MKIEPVYHGLLPEYFAFCGKLWHIDAHVMDGMTGFFSLTMLDFARPVKAVLRYTVRRVWERHHTLMVEAYRRSPGRWERFEVVFGVAP